ncbi:MAG: uroporphyrinogen-III C-methyltransferase [Candidatus Bathyarchaeota archaeon]|nr:uroporphyrinogen-III C-methyltransferase [Candidatus Bathyarchaeota archaeon]MCX8177202.1 uroporphyrinogen-III C-methyltransferase [Candidatus Bathyarchaeota archaeon]MDW8193555.1 uroporphyrinogen-III C-methyltransferase [Nitrososphaerota archaeon]
MGYGKVYLVGAGPGDPELLTLKAVEALKKADVVVYDRLVNRKILKLAPETAEKVYAGKASGRHTLTQEEINNIIVKAALQGKTVVRLKGGDPFLFGRGGEEAEALASKNIPFEVIPGVSSAFAAPAYAGIPLTHRNYASSVAIVTGSQAVDAAKRVEWTKLACAVDTIVILMGLEHIDEIVNALMDGGLSQETPVAIIEWGTLTRQRTLISRLADAAEESRRMGLRPPSVIVVGEVVQLGRKLSWFKKPLT